MKTYVGIILAALVAMSFMQGCSDDNGDARGFIDVNVSRSADPAVNPNNQGEFPNGLGNDREVSYYLIDVYGTNDTTRPVVPTTRIDPPDTSAVVFGLPVGHMLFVCKGYDPDSALAYQGSAQQEIRPGNNGALDIAVALAEWYWQNPLPQGNSIRSVWGTNGGEGGSVWGGTAKESGVSVFAVGDTGTVLHYDGTQWGIMDSGTYNHLHGVWGASATSVFAGGGKGTILRYDGTAWTRMDSGTDQRLLAIWGASESDVYVVGTNGTILHYNGTGWNEMQSPVSAHLTAVWGASSTDVFAVGEENVILHYDGSAWTTMDPGVGDFFYGVWGASGTDVYVVGLGGVILCYVLSPTIIDSDSLRIS